MRIHGLSRPSPAAVAILCLVRCLSLAGCVGAGSVLPAGSTSNGAQANAAGAKGDGTTADGGSAASSAGSTAAGAPASAAGPAATSREGDGNSTIGPNYTADANMNANAGAATRKLCQFVLSGDDSKYYTGSDPLLNKSYAPIARNIYVGIPSNLPAGKPAPLMIVHDAQYARGYLDHVLDNLAAQKALPPMVSIGLDNGGGDSFGSERGLEYDVVSDKYGQFLQNEVLPAIEKKCQVTLSTDPAARGVLGLSSGGAAAIGLGYWHPEWFGRLVTYSATMIAQFPTKDFADGAWAYPTQLFPGSPAKNLRIFLCAGEHDLQAGQNDKSDFLLANRKAADVLAAKGYHYKFVYALDAKHTDDRVVRQTLPTALAWAWRGYVAP